MTTQTSIPKTLYHDFNTLPCDASRQKTEKAVSQSNSLVVFRVFGCKHTNATLTLECLQIALGFTTVVPTPFQSPWYEFIMTVTTCYRPKSRKAASSLSCRSRSCLRFITCSCPSPAMRCSSSSVNAATVSGENRFGRPRRICRSTTWIHTLSTKVFLATFQ